jgi:protein gp37
MASRLARIPATSRLYRGVAIKGRWNGTIAVAGDETWEKPLHWKKPRRIFVCSMGDMFHEGVRNEELHRIRNTAGWCPQHEFLWLTKRGERMVEFTNQNPPPPNVWCGISASTSDEVRAAVGNLRHVHSQVRWLSLEPLVEDLVTPGMSWAPVDWIVIGCESGPNRRPCKVEWVQNIVQWCRDVGQRVYVKQFDIMGHVIHDMDRWPEDLRVRQWPANYRGGRPGPEYDKYALWENDDG